MKILVFTEGTILAPRSFSEADLNDFTTYAPIGHAVEKLSSWKQQGAEIHYLTSRTIHPELAEGLLEVDIISHLLQHYHFPDAHNLHFRKDNQTYADVAEAVMPDIVIEDDCASIGGEVEMTYPHLKPELKSRIKSIVVKEFAGIDNLPDFKEKFILSLSKESWK